MNHWHVHRWGPVALSIYKGCEFESQLGKHYFQRLTKVNATRAIRRPAIRQQYMWKCSRSLETTVEWNYGVGKPVKTWEGELVAVIRMYNYRIPR